MFVRVIGMFLNGQEIMIEKKEGMTIHCSIPMKTITAFFAIVLFSE